MKKIFKSDLCARYRRLSAFVLTLALAFLMLPVNTVANAAPMAAKPVASISAGYYDEPIVITLTSNTPGAVIYYIDNDTTPFSRDAWDLYTEPIVIATNTIISAIAIADGYSGSEIVTYEYKIGSMAKGYVYWSVDIGQNVPMAVITNSASSLKYAVTTTSEWWEVDSGTMLTVRLQIDNAANSTSSEAALLLNSLGNNKLGQLYDINLYKRMGFSAEAKVRKPNLGMNVIMVVPLEAFNTDITKLRVYNIMYAASDGTVKTNPVFRTAEGFLFFTAPESTTYALVYQDIPNPEYQ